MSSESYASSFGFEWNVYSRTQIDDASSSESEEAFAQKTGFSPADIKGKTILDVGCGMGRFSEVASRWGARLVVGIDLSTAVDAAHANLGLRENVAIAQTDVFELPFADKTFDYIFSIGVLHHTPDTRRAFLKLPKLLKPGGRIAIWVYGEQMRRWSWTSDFYRLVTTRLPKRFLLRLSKVANPLYSFHGWLQPRSPRLASALRVAIPTSMHPKAEWRVLDTFDWYSPRYQWKHSVEEVREWFREAGLTEIRLLPVPTSVQGRAPQAPPAQAR